MERDTHYAIAGKLEASKSAGWLSHYLVAWHRIGSNFTPEVRIWRVADQNDDMVKAYLSGLLRELVPSEAIVIAGV